MLCGFATSIGYDLHIVTVDVLIVIKFYRGRLMFWACSRELRTESMQIYFEVVQCATVPAYY